jgi:hypothetical protein
MISVLSPTEQTDQLSTSRDVLTVVGKLDDCAAAGGHTIPHRRICEAGRLCS